MSAIDFGLFARDFRKGEQLEHEGQGTAWRIFHLPSQRQYFYKCIVPQSMEEIAMTVNEIEVTRALDDPRITQLAFFYFRQDRDTICQIGLIFELVYYSSLQRSISLWKEKAKVYEKHELKQFITTGLHFFAYMQRLQYIHRDIRPATFLIQWSKCKKTTFKIGEFGISIKSDPYNQRPNIGASTYLSPKLKNISIVKHQNIKDDVFSFGLTMYQFMTLCRPPITQLKLIEAGVRYGQPYFNLLSMMIRAQQSLRPDFQYLQSYCIKEGLISQQNPRICKCIPFTSANGKLFNEKINMNQQMWNKEEFDNEKMCNKGFGIKMMRDKEFDSRSKPNTRLSLKSAVQEDKVMKKKQIISYRENIYSLGFTDQLLLIGSQGNLGVMDKENTLKVIFDSACSHVTFFKVDMLNIYFSTMNGLVYSIEIKQLNSLMEKNKKLLMRQVVKLPIREVRHNIIYSGESVSCFDYFFIDHVHQPFFTISHHTGAITYIHKSTTITQAQLSMAPIIQIQYYKGSIYSSTTNGLFKRDLQLSAAQWGLKEGWGRKMPLIFDKSNSYNHDHMIIEFKIIEKCPFNEGIKDDSNKIMAILISYDSLVIFLSRNFRPRQIVNLCSSSVITAALTIDPLARFGATAHVIDSKGEIYSENGELIDSTGQEKVLAILVKQDGRIFMGTNCGQLAILTPTGKRESDHHS